MKQAAAAAAATGETAPQAPPLWPGRSRLGLFGRIGSSSDLQALQARRWRHRAGVVVGGLVIGGAQLAGYMSGDSATVSGRRQPPATACAPGPWTRQGDDSHTPPS
jgi:hypothetical protein